LPSIVGARRERQYVHSDRGSDGIVRLAARTVWEVARSRAEKSTLPSTSRRRRDVPSRARVDSRLQEFAIHGRRGFARGIGPLCSRFAWPREDATMSIESRKVYCTFPKEMIKEPLLYNLGKHFNVIPNIRGASITDEVGLVFLELEGESGEIEKALDYLRSRRVKIDEVASDEAPR
jgi:L-aspartate semialdehyde sulfurtransferase ferredoxin